MDKASKSVFLNFILFYLPKLFGILALAKVTVIFLVSVAKSEAERPEFQDVNKIIKNFENHAFINFADNSGCDCGWRNLASKRVQIVGGNETGINEFPAMAGLVSIDTKSLVCGAHIISDRYLLTAAHCLFEKDPNKLVVLVGDHNITSGDDTSYSALYYISAYEIHPDYDNSIYANDIAIVQTTTSIVFSQYVAPICLPFKYSGYDFSAQSVIILGWGQIEFSGPTSDVLLKASLSVISNDECSAMISDTLVPQEMCAYASGKDSCQLDSGGPLLWTDVNSNRMHLAGIISHGIGCASFEPSVNTRVTSFLSWIIARTSDSTYCYM